MVEIVAEQLRRVGWVSGHTYVESEGYRLDWSPEGSHRMMLLQIALKDNNATTGGLDQVDAVDPKSHDAIKDFWDACIAQLALQGGEDALAVFVRIIHSWQLRA